MTSRRWGRNFLDSAMAHAGTSVAEGTLEQETWEHQGLNWSLIDNGILVVEPVRRTPWASTVLSAAIHGNETAPAEMLDRIVADLAAGSAELGCRLLAIVGNPPAVVAGARFVEENLNRLFSGAHRARDHDEAKRAAVLERAVVDFFDATPADQPRLHFELHTAIRASELERFAVLPSGQDLSPELHEFLRRADIHAALLDNSPSTTFSYFSSNACHANAMTLELGRVSPLGENDPDRLAAIDACFRAVLREGWPAASLPPARPHLLPSDPPVFRVEHELLRTDDVDFALNVADDAPNFALLSDGLAVTSSTSGGVTIEGEGRRIVFPNPNVPVGQRVGLVIKPS